MERKITCPLEIIFHILRGKWTPMIVWRARLGNQRIADLKRDIVDCNEKMIIQHINELLEYKILEKIVFDTYPKHTEYRLTEFGWKLIPVLTKFQELGLEYLRNSELLTKEK